MIIIIVLNAKNLQINIYLTLNVWKKRNVNKLENDLMIQILQIEDVLNAILRVLQLVLEEQTLIAHLAISLQ